MFRHYLAIIKPYYKNRFNESVLIVRPDDDPIGPKHVALYVLLMVIIDVLDGNTSALFKHEIHRDKES